MFSSWVWSFGRKSRVAKERSNTPTICSTSAGVARLSMVVGYGHAQARRARPSDAHLHARRRQGGDEPRRRLARLEARPAGGSHGRRGRAEFARRLGGG